MASGPAGLDCAQFSMGPTGLCPSIKEQHHLEHKSSQKHFFKLLLPFFCVYVAGRELGKRGQEGLVFKKIKFQYTKRKVNFISILVLGRIIYVFKI